MDCDLCLSHEGWKRIKQFVRNKCFCTSLAVVSSMGILIIIFGLVVIHHIDANVEDARLDSFAFSPNGSVTMTTPSFFYNISVVITVRNPNRIMKIKYTQPLVVSIVFNGRRLYNISVADKKDKHRQGNTKLHTLQVAREVPSYVLGAEAVEEFEKQNATGLFNMEVLLSGEIQYLGCASVVADKRVKLGLTCPLSLQIAPPGAEVVVFREVNCKPDKREKIYY